MIAHSAAGSVVSAVAGFDRPGEKDYRRLLAGRVTGNARLVSAQGPSGPAAVFAKRNGHRHDSAHSWGREREDASQYVARLRSWIRRFHGVSTKHLPNYLVWHRYQEALAKPGVELARWRLSPVLFV
jgi:hypothetical protein